MDGFVAQFVYFCVVFCRSLFLYFCPLYCLSLLDLRHLITSLVPSSFCCNIYYLFSYLVHKYVTCTIIVVVHQTLTVVNTSETIKSILGLFTHCLVLSSIYIFSIEELDSQAILFLLYTTVYSVHNPVITSW